MRVPPKAALDTREAVGILGGRRRHIRLARSANFVGKPAAFAPDGAPAEACADAGIAVCVCAEVRHLAGNRRQHIRALADIIRLLVGRPGRRKADARPAGEPATLLLDSTPAEAWREEKTSKPIASSKPPTAERVVREACATAYQRLRTSDSLATARSRFVYRQRASAWASLSPPRRSHWQRVCNRRSNGSHIPPPPHPTRSPRSRTCLHPTPMQHMCNHNTRVNHTNGGTAGTPQF